MNTSNIILLERLARKKKVPISSTYMKPAHLFSSNRHFGSALRTVGVVVVIAFLSVLSSAAFGANPAEEMAKAGTTGGIDPKGNSWVSIQQSIEQFGHPQFILRLFLSLSLAVGCAWAIAWHPRRSSLMDPLSDFEERKALILLGMVGAVVAELSGTSQTLAFVIFGIGALLRFRTLLDNRSSLGKPSRSSWSGSRAAWDPGRWRSSLPHSPGYSSSGLIHMRAAESGSDSTTT